MIQYYHFTLKREGRAVLVYDKGLLICSINKDSFHVIFESRVLDIADLTLIRKLMVNMENKIPVS